ncbi:MAG TPA: hypothetical protein VF006_09010 [Longimicrobium sp.]
MRPIPLFAIALCAACAGPPAPEPARTPPPMPAATPAQRRPPPPAEVCRCITLCFVERGRLREIPVLYSTQTGDTLTKDSLPLSTAVPLTGEYASVAGWYVNDEPITVRGRPFRRHARPRVLGIEEVVKIGEHDGVGVYAEAEDTASASRVVYLPTRPGCEFQPYVDVDSMDFPRR